MTKTTSEHSDLDISAINFGNFMFGKWLEDEDKFWERWSASLPQQICMVSVWDTLVKLGEMQKWNWKGEQDEITQSAMQAGKERFPEADQNKLIRIAKTILVFNNLAEKRLKTTAGL